MAAPPAEVLHLPEPVEGELEGTDDILFFRIGASVPLTPSCSKFDLEDPPARPLVVSERFGLLFVSHSEGFLVAKTKDVIGLAKKIKAMVEVEKEKRVKEKAKRPSIQEFSIVDVRIGKVSILSLSKGSSFLAATVGGEIRVFPVHSLLKKEKEPLLACSLPKSDHVKDFQWCQKKDKSFIALSTCDSLYYGNLDGHLNAVMNDVKAVDCSTDGNFFIVAREHIISILSQEFDELLQIPISQTTFPGCSFVVDSIKWICNDIIILGCTQSYDDECDYMIQVINSRGCGFKASSQPSVVSFSGPFHGIIDTLSTEGGPHLLASYLDRWGLALIANRKNRDDHVVLLELPHDDKREEVVGLELEQEKFFPRIELQENGDDNLILGLDVDKISLFEKLEYKDREVVTELSPCSIVLCVSSEGKLIMFYITRISDPCIPPQVPIDDPDVNIAAIENDASISSSVRNLQDATFGNRKQSDSFCAKQDDINSGLVSSSNLRSDSLGLNSGVKLGFRDRSSTKISSIVSSTSTSGITQEYPIASQNSAVKLDFVQKESGAFEKVGQTMTFHEVNSSVVRREDSVLKDAVGVVTHSVPVDYRMPKTPEVSGQNISRSFYSVDDMVKELDGLLMSIEQKGGFADASTVHLKNSVFTLEKGLENLSQNFRTCKGAVAEIVGQVQFLQDKMVQISAWEGYIEGMVKQASNNEYRDIWNRQKLGPEFELKQQQILKEYHSLINQILEMERHFNALELKKFGESGVYKGRRQLLLSDSSRQIQMLHNTVSSQLAAAEHLAECLSRHMASLKVTSPAVKQQSITKELLESIGIENQMDSFQSPDVKRADFSPDSFKKIPLSSPSSTRRQYSGRNKSSGLNSFEPETTRRRRDSLDMSWSSFEPQKAMVKRMPHWKALKGSADYSAKNDTCDDEAHVIQDNTYLANRNFEEKMLKPMHDFQTSSVFKWARDLSKPDQVVESQSIKSPVEVGKSSESYSSALLGLSKTSTNNSLNLAYGSSTDKLNFAVASTKEDDLLTRKVSSSNSTFNSQVKFSSISGSTSEVPQPISPPRYPPTQVYDRKSLQVVSSAAVQVNPPSVNMLESSGKAQPCPSMEEKNLGGQDNALSCISHASEMSKITAALSHGHSSSALLQTPSLSPSSSSLSSSNSSSLHFVSLDEQVKGPTLVSAIVFGGSSDVSESSISETTSSQPLFSSNAFTFVPQSSQSSSSFPSTSASAISDGISSCISIVSSTRDTIVSSADVTTAFAGASSQLQSNTVTSTTNILPAMPSLSSEMSSLIPSTESKPKEVTPDGGCQEDEMDEEAPEAPSSSMLGLGGIGLFGLGSPTTQSVPKPNPFGGSFVSPANATPSSSPASTLTIPPGELFKPASFSVPQPIQSLPSMNQSGVSGGFSGFGKPAQIGIGQQALGSVLGTFGQSRQLGGTQGVGPGGFGGSPAPSTVAGGFTAASAAGVGFGASTGGGFAALASKSGGFAGAAKGGGFAALASSGGGFAGAATSGGGFSALASGSGGFGTAASAGGGFAGTATGGFGSGAGMGKPPVEVLMQMRK